MRHPERLRRKSGWTGSKAALLALSLLLAEGAAAEPVAPDEAALIQLAQLSRDSSRIRRDSPWRQGLGRGRAADTVLPHRGLYLVDITGYDTARFTDARGTLVIELAQHCNAWTLVEDLDITLSQDGHKAGRSKLIYNGVENHVSGEFTFAYARDHLGERVDFKGHAADLGPARLATFIAPPVADLEMPSGTVHPITHLRQVIAAAQRGEEQFQALVFDGANVVAYDAVAQIDPAVPTDKVNPMVRAVRELLDKHSPDQLPQGRIWPIDIDYFPANDQYARPVVRRETLMHETGITLALHLDFGDFRMDAKLAHLDVQEAPDCEEPRPGRPSRR
jgi:hypothetical protein